jgi:thymidylate synthase
MEWRRAKLEWPAARICDLLLGPPPDRTWLVDQLDEAIEQLREELARRREVEAELEALRSSATSV